MSHSRSSSIAAIIVLSIAAVLLAPSAISVPNGVQGVSQGGCSCHGTTPSDSVSASIEGLPDSYNYSEEYELTLSFAGGPSNPNNINQGGFNLWASHGTLSVVDGTAQIKLQNSEI